MFLRQATMPSGGVRGGAGVVVGMELRVCVCVCVCCRLRPRVGVMSVGCTNPGGNRRDMLLHKKESGALTKVGAPQRAKLGETS